MRHFPKSDSLLVACWKPAAYMVLIAFLLLAGASSSNAQGTATIVNGASFRRDQPLAPGAWASAFGTFANVGTVQNTVVPLPKNLGGVSVTVAGIEAPINYVSATQINFLIPASAPLGVAAVAVNTPGGTVNGTITLISTAPGIFTKDGQTPPAGAILNQDSSENGQNRPAIRGQAISIYATGAGALTSAVADGAAAPSNPPAVTQSTPQVLIGGVECAVEFSGMAPGFAGLWQINARLPNSSFLSGKLPVQVFMNGVDSNEVTIFVAQ